MNHKKTKQRVLSYDVFRGILILGMVFFHVFVNFFNSYINQDFFYWISVGFIFFYGVILGQFLHKKEKKIVLLSVKLLGVFLIFNLPVFFKSTEKFLWKNFLLGNQDIFSFEILLPMGIFALLSVLLTSFFIRIKKSQKLKFLAIIFIICLILLIIFSDFIDYYSYNLIFLIYGFLGYLIALIWDLDAFAKEISVSRYFYLNLLLLSLSFILTYFATIYRIVAIFQVLSLFVFFYPLKSSILKSVGEASFLIYIVHILLLKMIKILML